LIVPEMLPPTLAHSVEPANDMRKMIAARVLRTVKTSLLQGY
jgi:hypothetical protein